MGSNAGRKITIATAFIILVAVKIFLLNNVLSSGTIGPLGLKDELIYRLNSESIFNKTFYYSDHYPPFYPLLLSFAFFSKNNWYQWMFYINAVLSSLILIPVWFISLRFLSRGASLSVLLISSLYAFHFFYPGLIMSENLYVPVFVFSVYLLLHTGIGPQSKKMTISALLGITMALGYMTKYIYLVAIPVLLFLWFIKPLFHDDPLERKVRKASRWFELLAMAAGFMSMFLPWYVYKYYSGFGIFGGMGAKFVLKGIPQFADLENLVLWTCVYLSYSLLSLAPFLLVLVFYVLMLSSKNVKNNRQETFFILAVMLLSAVFLMTAVQHSWRAGYNYPLPYRMHGRYLMHLKPLWVIVFMIALYKVKDKVAGSNLTQRLYSCITCFIILSIPFVLLFLSHYERLLSESYPAFFIHDKTFFIFLAAIIIFIMGIILSLSGQNRLVARHFVLLVSTLVIVVQAYTPFAAYKYILLNRTGYQLHGRALSPFIKQEVKKDLDKIIIVSNQTDLLSKSGLRVEQSLQFWVSESGGMPSIKFISFDEYSSHDVNLNGKLYSITTKEAPNPVYIYNVEGKNYYIYDIATWPGKMINITPGGPSKTRGESVTFPEDE
ncbi:MAG: hypothetical protein C4538_07455 [Nitrospiraceae bacterium]|nr:MAG: hypothetical protein C4538_07455 [Nitrospiraceae bacterium]